MDFSVFDSLFDFLSDLKNWVTFFTDTIKLMPSFFLTMISITLISIIVIGIIIFIVKLIG